MWHLSRSRNLIFIELILEWKINKNWRLRETTKLRHWKQRLNNSVTKCTILRFHFANKCQGYFTRSAKGKFQLLSDHLEVLFCHVLILLTYSWKRLVQFPFPPVLSIWMFSASLIKIIKVKSSHLHWSNQSIYFF